MKFRYALPSLARRRRRGKSASSLNLRSPTYYLNYIISRGSVYSLKSFARAIYRRVASAPANARGQLPAVNPFKGASQAKRKRAQPYVMRSDFSFLVSRSRYRISIGRIMKKQHLHEKTHTASLVVLMIMLKLIICTNPCIRITIQLTFSREYQFSA